MIKHESALDLFQRLNVENKNPSELVIDRLNRYHEVFFPDGTIHRAQIIELLDSHRLRFLHGFLSDYIECLNYRDDLLQLPW